jgi:hypothetical protein
MCKTKNSFIILLNELLAHRDVFNQSDLRYWSQALSSALQCTIQ